MNNSQISQSYFNRLEFGSNGHIVNQSSVIQAYTRRKKSSNSLKAIARSSDICAKSEGVQAIIDNYVDDPFVGCCHAWYIKQDCKYEVDSTQ